MSFGLAELCLQEGLHQVPCHSRAHCPATHANNIHVIVLHPLTGGEMIVDQSGTDAGNLVCTDRCPNAAAADGHAALDLPCRDSPGERSDIFIATSSSFDARCDGKKQSRTDLVIQGTVPNLDGGNVAVR